MSDRLGMNDTQTHGTEARRRTHLARGEPLCPECAAVVGVLDLEEGWLSGGLADDEGKEARST